MLRNQEREREKARCIDGIEEEAVGFVLIFITSVAVLCLLETQSTKQPPPDAHQKRYGTGKVFTTVQEAAEKPSCLALLS